MSIPADFIEMPRRPRPLVVVLTLGTWLCALAYTLYLAHALDAWGVTLLRYAVLAAAVLLELIGVWILDCERWNFTLEAAVTCVCFLLAAAIATCNAAWWIDHGREAILAAFVLTIIPLSAVPSLVCDVLTARRLKRLGVGCPETDTDDTDHLCG